MKVVVDFILSTLNTVKRYAHGQPAQTSKQRKFKYTWFANQNVSTFVETYFI